MEKYPVAIEEHNFWEDPAAAGPPIDVFGLLSVFLGRWPFIALLSLVGMALAVAISFLLTPKFMSRAVFLPPAQQVSSTDSAISLLFKTPSTAIYSGLIMSDSVLGEVVTRTDLIRVFKSKDIEQARDSLRAITQTTTDAAGFVTLQITSTDPRLARDIAQNFLVALSHLNDRLAVSEASQQRVLFQTQLESAKNDLESAEVALKKAEEASGVVSPESQIKSGLAAIDLARADIRAKRVALAALLKSETEQGPDVQRLNSEIAAEEAQLGSLQGSSSTAPGSGLSAAAAPSVSLRFVELEREVKYQQVLFDVMAKQYESAKLQESSAAPTVQVVDYPEIPLHKSWPTRKLFAIVGAFLGFVLACILTFLSNRIRAARVDNRKSASFARLTEAISNARILP